MEQSHKLMAMQVIIMALPPTNDIDMNFRKLGKSSTSLWPAITTATWPSLGSNAASHEASNRTSHHLTHQVSHEALHYLIIFFLRPFRIIHHCSTRFDSVINSLLTESTLFKSIIVSSLSSSGSMILQMLPRRANVLEFIYFILLNLNRSRN